MADINSDTFEEIVKFLNKARPKLNGFVWIPSINGFDIYEFDAEKLKTMIRLLSWDNDLTNAKYESKNG